jgi:hypothetical protein
VAYQFDDKLTFMSFRRELNGAVFSFLKELIFRMELTDSGQVFCVDANCLFDSFHARPVSIVLGERAGLI